MTPLDKPVRQLKTFYYMAYRKARGRRAIQVGDGIIDAPNKLIARQRLALSYHTMTRQIKLRLRQNPAHGQEAGQTDGIIKQGKRHD